MLVSISGMATVTWKRKKKEEDEAYVLENEELGTIDELFLLVFVLVTNMIG